MTSQPEQPPCVRTPPHTLILLPLFFCHHPLSILSPLLLVLLLLCAPTASQLSEIESSLLRNTSLSHPHSTSRTMNMPPESSSKHVPVKVQPNDSKFSVKRTFSSDGYYSVSPSISPPATSENKSCKNCRINPETNFASTKIQTTALPHITHRQSPTSVTNDTFEMQHSKLQVKSSVSKEKTFESKNTWVDLAIQITQNVENSKDIKCRKSNRTKFNLTESFSKLFPTQNSSILLNTQSSLLKNYEQLLLHPHTTENTPTKETSGDVSEKDVSYLNSEEIFSNRIKYASSKIPQWYTNDKTSLNSNEFPIFSEVMTSKVPLFSEATSNEILKYSDSFMSVNELKNLDREQTSTSRESEKLPHVTSKSLAKVAAENHSQMTSFRNNTIHPSDVFETPLRPDIENVLYWEYLERNFSGTIHISEASLPPPKSLSLVNSKKRNSTTFSPSLPQRSSSPMKKSADHLESITVLGLFEMTTRNGERTEGRSELAAARLAVSHINEKQILPGYQLELLTNDTKCDPGVGVDTFFHALYTKKSTRMVMLLGTACSDVTESLAKVMPYWNIVQVSFGSTSPALSDRQEFPLFYRTVAPDSSHNPARLAFVRGFGWDTVTALSQNEDVYSLAVNDLVTELEQANITCRATITFAESDFKDQLRMLRDLDTRIIIGSFSHEVAPKIFCEAHHLGMYGSDYAWILQGGPSDIWWENVTECPQHHLAEAVEGLLLVSSHNSIVGLMPSYSGLTNARFLEEFETLSLPVTRYAPQTYDAVWAMALALRGAQQKWEKENLEMSVHQFDYNRRDMAEEFLTQLGQLDFLGVSGPVSFSGADRTGISAFYQVQGGDVSKVALFYPYSDHMDFSCPDCKPLVWQGGQVPIAKRVFKLRVVTIEPAAFLSITCLALIGITLAFAFLAFNLHFRKLKYIKLSSPRLNNMAVVGCILVYTAVILLGLDHATLPTNTHFPVVCTARVYLLSAGFSLAFGSMFTKTYRVHRIFTRSRSGVVKNKLLQDTQLISLICVLLLIDGLIVTLWVIIDPIQRHLRNLTLEISASDRSVVYQPQVEVCRSQYTHGWLGALYGYKGLLLIVGVYMAWETRHVKIPALNDSQYIGMSVYSVVITSAIVVVLANLISERATLAFVTITTLILTSTTATLCLLFLPKLHAILGNAEDNGDPIVHSMGLKIEYNTRRFVTDDRRELYYRVEVQNRVYRREITALDQEIGRLKRQLLESPGTSSESMSEGGTSKKTDISPDEKGASRKHNVVETHPSPSVGGGLPLLLLSVLPPVIPRASWPSADHANMSMRRQVTFSSEPKLDDSTTKQSAGDREEYYNITYDNHDGDTETSGKLGVLGRLKNLLGSRPSSRKTSAASFAGTSSGGGIASALRLHMGYLAGIVPSSNPTAMTSSCNTSINALNQYGLGGMQTNVAASSRELHPLKRYCGRVAGGSGPIISVTSNDEPEANIYFDEDDCNSANRRKFSLAMCLSNKDKDFGAEERRVSYSAVQRGTIRHQHSQPILSFRERAKGSPRFPHKIVPTCSLNALEDRRRSSSSAGAVSYSANPSGSNPSYLARRQSSQHHLHVSARTVRGQGKCRSLEDATSIHMVAGPSGAGASGSNWKPRAASYSPNCDVWATAEFGIPLSELESSGRYKDNKSVPPNVQRSDSQCSQGQL